jgi:hypothetical protein
MARLRALAPLVLMLALAALRLAIAPAHAGALTVQRCETTDGRVTYSDGACPAGTTLRRTLDYAPSLEVGNGSASLKSDRPDDGNPAPPKGSPASATPVAPPPTSSGAITRVPHGGARGDAAAGAADPDALRAAASERRKARLATCDSLVRQIEYAQDEFDAADAAERASRELELRRLQADHKARCAPAKLGAE